MTNTLEQMTNTLVGTEDLEELLASAQVKCDDAFNVLATKDSVPPGDLEIISELLSDVVKGIITARQQFLQRDKLINDLRGNAMDISIDLEGYQFATHNYSGFSDDDRYIFDDIEKNEAHRRDLAAVASEVIFHD